MDSATHPNSLEIDIQETKESLEKHRYIMEEKFTLPLIKKKVGYSVVLSIVPFGGTINFARNMIYVHIARQYYLHKRVRHKLLQRIIVDFLLSTIPLLGPLAVWLYKANLKNLNQVIQELDKLLPETQS